MVLGRFSAAARSIVCFALPAVALTTDSVAQVVNTAQVIFVSEHGDAESVVATAYFNKLAAERGLAVRSTFRGVNPKTDLSLLVIVGLMEDGMSIPDEEPTAIDESDVEAATHIVAIGCALPKIATASGKAASWDDVPRDQGYEAMRNAILRRVRSLVESLRHRAKLLAGYGLLPAVGPS
jgi:protein-tyrosine-phosphatase